MPDADFVENPEKHRYEARLGGELVGLATYRDADGVRDITHTEIRPPHDGQGLGSQLVEFAVADIRGHGLTVAGSCPFVAHWLRQRTAEA